MFNYAICLLFLVFTLCASGPTPQSIRGATSPTLFTGKSKPLTIRSNSTKPAGLRGLYDPFAEFDSQFQSNPAPSRSNNTKRTKPRVIYDPFAEFDSQFQPNLSKNKTKPRPKPREPEDPFAYSDIPPQPIRPTPGSNSTTGRIEPTTKFSTTQRPVTDSSVFVSTPKPNSPDKPATTGAQLPPRSSPAPTLPVVDQVAEKLPVLASNSEDCGPCALQKEVSHVVSNVPSKEILLGAIPSHPGPENVPDRSPLALKNLLPVL